MKRKLLLACILALFSIRTAAQSNGDIYQLRVKKAKTAITLDGELNEAEWASADVATDFIQNFPTDSLPATFNSKVMVTFDNNNLYIAGICYYNDPNYIVQTLRRDFIWPLNDNFSVYFDPFNDYTNGFTFGLTPAGVQREGLVINGEEVSSDWDNKWYSEVKTFEDRWQFEMSIPFKTIRYNENNREWNLILLRNDLVNNERTSWAPVPQGFRASSFVFGGKMIFDDPLRSSGTNISVIPYVSGNVSRNFEDGEPTESTANAGFDAKVALSSSLNLDLTYNPDFSQVEVDQQVTNLSRFEIFFPERRQFFLENSDLFAENGFRNSRAFFSRRIGIAQDTAGNSVQIPIQYGLRLSGKVGQKWRVGLLNMQTRETQGARPTGVDEIEDSFVLPIQNYTVAILQKQVFARSNINAIFVNRDAMNFDRNDTTLSTTQYNRVYGLDYNLLSKDNRWEGDFFIHRSVSPGKQGGNWSSGAFLRYAVREFRVGGVVSSVGENYNAEVGFVQRTDVVRSTAFADFFFYPNSKIINNHGPGARFNNITDQNFNTTDQSYNISYQIEFLNTSRLEAQVEHRFELLRNDFDPTRADTIDIVEGSEFDWNVFSLQYNTDTRKLFSVDARTSIGGFYDGQRFNFSGQFNYRYQPLLSIALRFDYNRIYSRPAPFQDAAFLLVGPRIDLTFTDKLFLTTFVQYNEQSENINLNTRFQWRFKPVSDLFVVYTDNYFSDTFNVRNRALVLKLSYWLNI